MDNNKNETDNIELRSEKMRPISADSHFSKMIELARKNS